MSCLKSTVTFRPVCLDQKICIFIAHNLSQSDWTKIDCAFRKRIPKFRRDTLVLA